MKFESLTDKKFHTLEQKELGAFFGGASPIYEATAHGTRTVGSGTDTYEIKFSSDFKVYEDYDSEPDQLFFSSGVAQDPARSNP